MKNPRHYHRYKIRRLKRLAWFKLFDPKKWRVVRKDVQPH